MTACLPLARQAPRRDYGIPIMDISDDTFRQVVVDGEAGRYLDHPTTVLLHDGVLQSVRMTAAPVIGSLAF